MEKAKTERNYGIDLLRIFAMMMIVLLHVINQGGVLNATAGNVVNHLIARFLVTTAYGAVNCYALVSGYVGVYSKHRHSSLMQLYLQVIFYTVAMTSVFYFLSSDKIGMRSFLNAFLPVSNESYWYFTAYFGMYFFAPFLNKMILSLSKREAKTLIITIIMVLSVIPCVSQKDVFKSAWGYSMIWLCALYLFGGCIKITESERKINKKTAFVIFIICIFITYASTFLDGINKYTFLLTYTSPTVLISAVALLVLFSQLKFKEGFKKVISFFSPLAFGVYLIHTEPHVWNEVLLGRFSYLGNKNPALFIMIIFAIIFAIWFACSMIDYVRLKIFKLLHIKKWCTSMDCKLEKISSSILR